MVNKRAGETQREIKEGREGGRERKEERKKLDISHHTKNDMNWITGLNIEAETIKLLQENLRDLGVHTDFPVSKALNIKGSIDFQNFPSKDTMSKMRITDRENPNT